MSYGIYMDLLTQGREVPNVTHGRVQFFPDRNIPDHQVIASPKFAWQFGELFKAANDLAQLLKYQVHDGCDCYECRLVRVVLTLREP